MYKILPNLTLGPLNKETDNNNKKRQRKLKAELRDTNLVERPGI